MTDGTFRRAMELLEADIDDELVALEPAQGACFGFSPVAKHVWRSLESPKTFDQLREELLQGYEVTSEQCTRELRYLLGDMLAKGLIAAV